VQVSDHKIIAFYLSIILSWSKNMSTPSRGLLLDHIVPEIRYYTVLFTLVTRLDYYQWVIV